MASKTMVSRTGIRGSNDLVWVGNAANIAKLAALHSSYPTYITADVYNMLGRDQVRRNAQARHVDGPW